MMNRLFVIGCIAALSCVVARAEDVALVSMGPDEVAASLVEQTPELQMSAAERGAIAEATDLIRGGDNAGAGKIIDQLLERYPDNRQARQLQLVIFIEMKRYAEAGEAFAAMMKDHADDFRFLNNYAWFLATAEDVALRDPARALDLAREAVLIAPEVYNIWSTLAEAYYRNGDFERALKSMQQALELAMRQQAGPEVIEKYRSEYRKMAEANSIMSLME
jgi:Tfp pilus assembly protein PilF